jgi:hypothetical protein
VIPKKYKGIYQHLVPHRFRVIKLSAGFLKVRYCELKKNTAKLDRIIGAVEFVDGVQLIDESARWAKAAKISPKAERRPIEPKKLRNFERFRVKSRFFEN